MDGVAPGNNNLVWVAKLSKKVIPGRTLGVGEDVRRTVVTPQGRSKSKDGGSAKNRNTLKVKTVITRTSP